MPISNLENDSFVYSRLLPLIIMLELGIYKQCLSDYLMIIDRVAVGTSEAMLYPNYSILMHERYYVMAKSRPSCLSGH